MDKQIAALATNENNVVMWDIDALLFDCKDYPHITVDTEMLVPQQWLTIDTQYALTTDTSKPIVLFELPNNLLYIADGNHRLYRAVTEHIPRMNVIVVPQEKHLSHLFRCSTDMYYLVIEGLREEGVFIHNFIRN